MSHIAGIKRALRRNATVVADTTAPTLFSAVIPGAGTTMILSFVETVSIGAGGNGGWVPTLSGGAATLTYSAGSGTTALTYTLNRTVAEGETGTVAYTQPGNGVEDTAGNDLASIVAATVTNNRDSTAPTLTTATIPAAGTTMILAFSEVVAIGAGGNGGWVPTLTGGAATLTYASGDGSASLTYTLNRTVDEAETGTLAYTQPTNGVEDLTGNDLANIAAAAITNDSEQPSGAVDSELLNTDDDTLQNTDDDLLINTA
jgi:uncharacterized repeat protein (TIGR02059 family)